MHDPDFHGPATKFPVVSDHSELAHDALPPTSKLAVVSLVFGILGLTLLPIVGSLVAIVAGHFAIAEIRASEGRLGGRAMARVGLILGYLLVVLALLVIGLALALFTARFSVVQDTATIASPAPMMTAGVKMANELTVRDLQNLKKFDLFDGTKGEEWICYFNNPTPSDGEPEMAGLTTKRVLYLKGNRPTIFELNDIESIIDSDQYRQKYTPNYFDFNRYMIEIKTRSGARMRIVISPSHDGPLFYQAIKDAWMIAEGRTGETSR